LLQLLYAFRLSDGLLVFTTPNFKLIIFCHRMNKTSSGAACLTRLRLFVPKRF
jgi:hypothetical protein